MKSKLNWKKEILSDTYKIRSNYNQIGELKSQMFSQTSNGDINGKEYTFVTKGFFNQYTEIYESNGDAAIGDITYGNCMTKANISIHGEEFKWKYSNVWSSKWCVKNTEGSQIDFVSDSSGGNIESNIDNDLLLLTGLFVTNFYLQINVILIVIFFIVIY